MWGDALEEAIGRFDDVVRLIETAITASEKTVQSKRVGLEVSGTECVRYPLACGLTLPRRNSRPPR